MWCLIMNQELAKVLDKNLTAHLDDVYEDAVLENNVYEDAVREVATIFADERGFTHT